ncbi:hypothetical protein GHT06_001751 [Daphnia sinensis]|uniref:Cell division cycle protein 27 homolog n=1 Tax=Daphnia sinensis TaxID=1820382 RepID=A0AAD5PKC6_9CRUS|nr:hypothetical protein GHT06_001594 [Daphnia sinensis]KAI9550395.1 hypothetical protein GHT06_001751 [Daphnia sinensis]
MLVQEPVQAAIWHCLNHYNYWNATFLAEKLQDEINNEESLYLLATCYYRSGKANQARSLLQSKGTQSPQCQYLLAKCCLDLNKLAEAEGTLMGGNIFKQKSLDDVVAEYGDAAAFALVLLGQVYMQTERKFKAIEVLNRALKLNPFLWAAFELLCRLGEKPDAEDVFQLDGLENFSHCHGTNPIASLISAQINQSNDANTKAHVQEPMSVDQISTPILQIPSADVSIVNTSTPLPCVPLIHHNIPNLTPDDQMIPSIPLTSTMAPTRSRARSFRLRSVFKAGQALSPMSPNFGIIPLDTSSASDASQSSMVYLCPSLAPSAAETKETKIMPKRLGGRRETASAAPSAPSRMGVFCQSGNTATPTLSSPPAANVRRSTRLYSSNNSVKENNKSSSRFVVPKLPLKRSKSKLTKSDTPESGLAPISDFQELIGKLDKEDEKPGLQPSHITSAHTPPTNLVHEAVQMQKQSAEGLMSLLRIVGKAFSHLTSYESRQAIDTIEWLSARHKRSSWVLSLMAKAYFELADYKQATRLFQEVREMEPYRTDLMEYYSTALWHLQQEVALSALAQDMLEQDKMSAATWCCAGNCLDLQKDREQALKFFQRAIQVDPKFAYAYTLLGHQYLALEETEKAMDCFKNAVRVDPIHYNGWYGMGIIYYKQERYSMAEFYFKKALDINKNSPVLKCHVAIVEHALQRTDRALQMLNSALAVEERNPLCKFHRASIYFACDRLDEALAELHELKEIAPREALVYYLMGNVYKKRNETHLALTNFSWANDLDPKGASGARRHIKEVIDPTSSLSLVPVSGISQEPHQASISNDQDEGSTVEGGNHSGASNNLSNESLEMPPLPTMDSGDGDHFYNTAE